jgi:hypothetical protein
MKIGRFLIAAVMAVSVSGFAFAAEDAKKPEKKYSKDSCCAKAVAKGETCKHPCCVDAEKKGAGEVCTKCNKPEKEAEKK